MKIQVNKKAINFKLQSTSGKIFNLSDVKNGLVVYFYPKDNTPGCTLETKDFSLLYKKFKSLKYEVVGISKDNMESHIKFKKNSKFLSNSSLTKKFKYKKNMVSGDLSLLWVKSLWEQLDQQLLLIKARLLKHGLMLELKITQKKFSIL